MHVRQVQICKFCEFVFANAVPFKAFTGQFLVFLFFIFVFSFKIHIAWTLMSILPRAVYCFHVLAPLYSFCDRLYPTRLHLGIADSNLNIVSLILKAEYNNRKN